MKLLSSLVFVGLLSVTACSHHTKSCCQPKQEQMCTKEKCDKPCCDKEKKCSDGSCVKEKDNCTDGSCKKKS